MNKHFKHPSRAGVSSTLACLPALFFGWSTVFLVACTGSPIAPTEQIAASTAATSQAISAGAADLAPVELRVAREKLDRANAAMGARDFEQARLLAEQAQVDAQLAATKARSIKAQKAAAVLQADSRALQEEINRNSK